MPGTALSSGLLANVLSRAGSDPVPERAVHVDVGLELTDWWTDREGMYALSLARRL